MYLLLLIRLNVPLTKAKSSSQVLAKYNKITSALQTQCELEAYCSHYTVI